MEDTAQKSSVAIYLGLFLLSVSALASEILLMRIVSVVFFIIVVYVVIGIAMIGFSAAGTFLSVYSSLVQNRGERALAGLALAFSILTPITYYLAVTPAPCAVGKAQFALYLMFVSVVMTVHFFFAGLIISFLFTKRMREINRLYFINLVGSGIGCFVVIRFIRPLGGEGLILLVTLLGTLAAVFFALGSSRTLIASLASVYAIVILCSFPFAKELFHIWPTLYGKHLAWIFKHAKTPKLEFQGWDPIARVDVASMEGEYLYMPEKLPFKFATNDGGAGTFIMGFDKDFRDVNFTDEWGTWGSPYWIKKNPEVLIIGLGGGPDVMIALHYEAKKIYGVEISERMIEVVRDRFKEFANHPYQRPNVEIIHDEGRSYVRRLQKKVDLIVMTGVDTVSAQLGGNFVMAENYLYTVEALKEYLEHLRDDGILCITRFVINREYPEKELRTCSMGVEALRRLGVERPEKNFIILSHGIWLTTLMKRTAFTESEISSFVESLEKYSVDSHRHPMPFLAGIYEIRYEEGRRLLYKPNDYRSNQFGRYLESVSRGAEKQFIAEYPWNITPCTDNRPFFFVAERWDNIFRGWSYLKKNPPVGLLFQLVQILWFGFLTLVLVLLPLYIFHRKGVETSGSKPCILYFSCLGIGFMMIEIGFMQKFTLFLGHPTYSVSVILFSLLCFSGLGSLVAGLLGKTTPRQIALLSIPCVGALSMLYTWILDPIFSHFLVMPLGTRILLSVGLVAPLAFFMGMPFPTGLRIVAQKTISFVPWAWGINGSASVMGILLGGLIPVFAGFSTMIVCAVLIYLTAMIAMMSSMQEVHNQQSIATASPASA